MTPAREDRPEAAPATLVVGVGNLLLGDEGFGVHVARALIAARARWPAGLEVIEAGSALLDTAGELAGRAHVVIVDAVRLGNPAGTRYRFELRADDPAEAGASASLSLHGWGVPDTFALLARLGRAPRRVTVLGAEPGPIAAGLALGEAMARAAAATVEDLLGGRGRDRAWLPRGDRRAPGQYATDLGAPNPHRRSCSAAPSHPARAGHRQGERAMPKKLDKKRLVALLNEDLAGELGAIIQYTTYAAKVTGPFRPQLAQFLLSEVPGETGHAQFLANKIVALGGEPVTAPRPVPQAGTNREMLQAVLEAEKRARADYTRRASQAEAFGDKGLQVQLENIVADESGHYEETERILREWPV